MERPLCLLIECERKHVAILAGFEYQAKQNVDALNLPCVKKLLHRQHEKLVQQFGKSTNPAVQKYKHILFVQPNDSSESPFVVFWVVHYL